MKKSEQCCCQTQLNRTEWYFARAAFCQAVKSCYWLKRTICKR